MGQALRRATGSVRAGRPDPPPPPVQRSPRPANVTETIKDESGVIEERDPRYDEMLRHMVGKITSRSGGKLEMGESARLLVRGPPATGRFRQKSTIAGQFRPSKVD
ncbi:hypothetical protein GW17_00005605 [Ensete ventricosum]|nr:hypothetical protein GW17_00005605 [Ensete ventricosum]